MPIKPPNSTNARSTLLGASHIDHTHAHTDTTGKTTDDHHNEAHTVASHSDTTGTGAELETLTDGSTTSLHSHSGLLTTEQVQDIVGAMVSSNTETLITVTYEDGDGTLDFVVAESSIDHDLLTGFVAAEHKLEAAIDHDALTNFVAAEHKLEAAIDHDALLNFVANEHLLVAAIDHDALLNFLATEHFTEASISHDNIADVSADDHHAQAHTVASHSDTTATGAELETLTGGAATTLHKHDHGGQDGLGDDDHTQYPLKSIFTTAGDLWYATGSATPVRLGIGTALQILATNSGATAPEWVAAPTGAAFSELMLIGA